MSVSDGRGLERALAWARTLRRKSLRWSATADREFHDALFRTPAHDPFSATYPGNITIRRFADRAGPFVAGSTAVVDLGCGPGEITCELARRHPATQFHGVDHSAAAIEQATGHAQRFGLRNATFEVADVSAYPLPGHIDVVTMFDAFHHLLDPAAFVRRLRPQAERFLLIEPAGDLLGRWRRSADFDWIPSELDKIRLRIEHEIGAAGSVSGSRPEPEAVGRAVENRYPVSDYEAFFQGYELEFAGTVAGLDAYPTAPDSRSEFRAELMEVAYRLLGMVDRTLFEQGIDLHSKHWVIHATPPGRQAGPRRSTRQPRPATLAASTEDPVRGPWDARYEDAQVPADMDVDREVLVEVTVRNESWRVWDSRAASQPVKLSYHWIGARGSAALYDGRRSDLPRPLEPGRSLRAAMVVQTPSTPGRYTLQIDLVEENVTWFSRAGTPPLNSPVHVRSA
jgi:SAM-dependent methyltransferase